MITLDKTMTIQALILKNFLCVQDAEYKFGQINIIKGQNGAGKSTLLDGIRFALGGGDEATLLRRGATEGAVGIVLSDGTCANRKLGAKSKPLTVSDDRGNVISSPATYLKSKFDLNSLDPMEFLQVEPRKQTALFLAASPIFASREELANIATSLNSADTSRHAVPLLAELIEAQKSERYSYSKTVREKTVHVAQLANALPAGAGNTETLAAELTQLDAQVRAVEAKRLQRRDEYRATADRQRADLQQSYDEKLAALNTWKAAEMALIERQHGEAVAEMIAKSGEKLAPVKERLTLVRELLNNAEVHRQTSENIKFNRAEIEIAQKGEDECNRIIGELEQYRDRLFASMPFPGVTIVEGEIHVDDKPLARLSTAERMRFAVRVATVRLGEIAAILVDNGECFDAANFEELQRECLEQGVQLFVSVRDEGELTISSN